MNGRFAGCFIIALAVAGAKGAALAAVVPLDGTWEAEVAPEAQGEAIPAAFTRTIPVPGHWPSLPGDATPRVEIDLGEEREVKECTIHWFHAWKGEPAKWRVVPALPARTRYVMVAVTDPAPNSLVSINEIELH